MFTRPLSFAVAGAAGAATLTAASAPSPLYPVYQQLWGFSAVTLTVVFAVYVFALLGALLTVGSLSDRVGRRPVASAALVLLAVGMLLFAIAGGTGGLMVARIVQGFAVGAATGTTTAMITDSAPSPRSGSLVSSAVPALGIAIGAVLAGALVQFAPLPRQLVFWLLAGVYLLLAVLVWWIPERTRTAPEPQQSIWRSLVPSAGLPPDIRPAFLALLPSITATWALAGLYLSLGSSILSEVLDVHSHFVVGVVLAAFFVAGIAGTAASMVIPPRRREWSGYGTLALGVLITVAALLANAMPLYVAGSVVAGFGFGASFRFAIHTLGEAAPETGRGQVFATMYIISYLAFSVPALAAGLAVEAFGLKPTAVGYGVLEVVLVLAAAIAGTARNRNRRTDAELVARTLRTPRQQTHYLECGPADGPLMIFLHGWPAIGLIWRAQMTAFAADGWHCVAPDLRGFGESFAPAGREAYAIREIVADMAEFHDHLGGGAAVWVGHDWGSIVVGALAAHEPQRCRGVVLTSWAYFPDSNSLSTLVPLVDRSIYPTDEYPDGQWDYYRYYTTHFDTAVADLDADPAATLASVYQPGSPEAIGKVAPTATVTRDGGRFGSAHHAPPTEPDPALWPPADFDVLVRGFKAQGFRPSAAWYTNDDANIAYAREARDGGRLSLPVLFVNGDWDVICSVTGNHQGDPMRTACADLTEMSEPAGHWLPLERKAELTETIRTWLRSRNL
ncbi:MFS transporter [Actinoplanes sp. N902-109]|uniref:MFS transporter n=1 Tax=Actinoplanes sp. (strain N902-109) TaxID=649831 RepID=UPI0003296797|nr:MFS transporter [Actinoplanes sp. N902-109]AGL16233.1 alpha/beta hydrolase fold protein [Actinoplanes sp. N902-109]